MLTKNQKEQLFEKLYRRYAINLRHLHRISYLWKKYSWLMVTQGSPLMKRLLDITLSSILLIALIPLLLIISIAIKLQDRGPIFYVSKRLGKRGKEFNFIKFRTMQVGAEEMKKTLAALNEDHDERRFKIKNDPRVTKLGRLLRKTSLDELPQLWCVLKGEMSLVGPRPAIKEEAAKYSVKERQRLDVTPGLTGLWQVSGRSEVPFDKQMKLDITYIKTQSFKNDLWILVKTIPAVLFGRGAY